MVVRGGRAKDYVIIPDPIKLSSLGLTPNSIITTFNNNNYVLSNGYVADYRRLYLSLTDTRVNDIEELKNLILKYDGNRIIKVKDMPRLKCRNNKNLSL